MRKVRVRFAPSPTGPLHIGGLRTALYNFLFARKHLGDFILRIEDTDQQRLVDGAEKYIMDALKWCGIIPDESPENPGVFGPYRQSERLNLYWQYVMILVESGHAYYAFDTQAELDELRQSAQDAGNHFRYDAKIRKKLKNSLNMTSNTLDTMLDAGTPFVIRIKMPDSGHITFTDMIRGNVTFDCTELDDKVLWKEDQFPTYHLANIVDDHLMNITHVIRGEEWLSSTPLHVFLYQSFGWESTMPEFAHLPLLLKPSGKGKLSKRDGLKAGFPVFPLTWFDEEKQQWPGYKEAGFLPEALINFLSLLGWNPGTEQEIFTLPDLIAQFDISRVSKSGARFDYEKALWFNKQYIHHLNGDDLQDRLKDLEFPEHIRLADALWPGTIVLMKDRADTLIKLLTEADYIFDRPTERDEKNARKKWNEVSELAYKQFIHHLKASEDFSADTIKQHAVSAMEKHQLGFGAFLPLVRIAIAGTLQGPDIFQVMELIGKLETIDRMEESLDFFESLG